MKQSEFITHLNRYLIGFGVALGLSVTSYLVVSERYIESAQLTMVTILLLAVIQLGVQLYCFLHLDGSKYSRDRTVSLGFTILMMLIIVIGSLWIMRNLDYRMGMTGEAMNEYMQKQNEKGF